MLEWQHPNGVCHSEVLGAGLGMEVSRARGIRALFTKTSTATPVDFVNCNPMVPTTAVRPEQPRWEGERGGDEEGCLCRSNGLPESWPSSRVSSTSSLVAIGRFERFGRSD